MSDTESIGKRIKRLRKERGMTQEELANAVGVSPQAVSKWENEYSCPDISILPALARVFGISADELLGSDPDAAAESGVTEDPCIKNENGKKKKRKHHWSLEFSRISPENFWGGIFIITAGTVLILGKATNIIPWGFWAIMWPVSLICAGMSFTCNHISTFSASLTLFGVYTLLCNTGVIPESFSGKWFVFGICLIIWGVSTVFSKFFIVKRLSVKRGVNVTRELHCENGYINYDGTFSSDNVAFDGEILRGGNIDALFGSYIIDLTTLTMVGENASLDIDVSFASLTLLIPRTVRITEARDTAFASVNIKGRADDDAPYSLNISSDVSFGSVDIKYV